MSSDVQQVVSILNILKGNADLTEEAFRIVLKFKEEKVELGKLIADLVNEKPSAQAKLCTCMGIPCQLPKDQFLGMVDNLVMRAMLTSPEEHRALKQCYMDVYVSLTTPQEQFSIITEWALKQNRKRFSRGKLNNLLDFIKGGETLPNYPRAPSYEPPDYVDLYTRDYKRPEEYAPRADYNQPGGRRRRSRQRSKHRSTRSRRSRSGSKRRRTYRRRSSRRRKTRH